MSNNAEHTSGKQHAVCPLCGLSDRSDSRCPCSERDSEALLGTVLQARYTVQRLLGRGSWSRVYLALDNILNRFVAIKVLRTELRNEPITVARFTREAQALAVLNHPNIVTIFDFGLTDDEAPYLVLEQVEGETLSSLIKNGGPLSSDRVTQIFIQCAAGLSAGHAKGVIHRDINPENIVVHHSVSGTHVKILDYGLCKMIYDEFDPKLTEKGVALATVNYMSPEMTSGGAVDQRSDLYSLGCVMHEALSGQPPFHADSYLEIAKNHLSKPAPRFNGKLGVMPSLEQIVLRCLEKDPAKRYQTADELIQQLQAAATRSSLESSAQRTDPASSKMFTTALSVACAILCIALLFMLISKG